MAITCREAHKLIDTGVRAGAQNPQRAALGFHLAACPRCLAYHTQADLALLGDLLADPLPVPSIVAPAPPPRTRPWRRLALTVLLLVCSSLVAVLIWVATAAYTIQQNVAAMQVTSPPTPTLTLPTNPVILAALAEPSPSPRPSGPTAPIGAEPPPPPTATIGPPPGFMPSPTPISLPSIIGGSAQAVPTLMATAPIIPVTGNTITILLLGSDRRPGESWATRSDAIVVLHLDPERQRVAMLSLPRDLVVPIPGYGYARINAATVYGDLYPELGGGLDLARRTVSQYLNLPINYVLRADFHAFTEAIDAIGGIEIDVPYALYDSAYPTIDYGYMIASFAPGLQHMDGATALIYARMRHADSAYARNRRQQQVLLAILQQAREGNILSQVQMITDVTSALRDDIQTDMSLERMLGLAWAFRNVSPAAVERYALDENLVYEGVLADDPYATFADPSAVRQVVNLLLNGPTNP
ncbi:cell envelope-related transcriptional attenuator [Oscillochloris trichoides DG-6]|uniref:Cell envelope-related transcriptional attenuator n=1 Tax=Oscillochloris trichoides DG-6 TaxID=765420 RepID=E1IBW3_9CHLR|nr:LCP family protein [Oscillochloris trichoides]EFO81343.1 cell envelope-related transcriptional attenuator [Oscillochloris trichoides DG-6]